MWHYESGGQQHGPVSIEELTARINSGEIHAGTLVWQEGMADWAPLSEACPQAIPVAPAPTPGAPGPAPGPAPSPYAPPGANPGGYQTGQQGGGYMEPHRGVLVLVLGIVGLCCCIPAIVAIILGHQDLQKIDAGQMDPEGRGLTLAGKILGIVGFVLNAIGAILNVLLNMGQAGSY